MTSGSSGRSRVTIVIIVAVLAGAFTGFSVWQSTRLGRLTSVPNYDDVVYFLSATRLIEAWKDAGIHGGIGQLRHHGLHAPFSTALATVAFSAAGYGDAAPYLFNAVIVLLYLGGLAWLLREWPIAARIPALVFYLTLPFATMAVVEFRPDLCWAVLVGLCAAWGMSAPDYFSRWGSPVIHVLLCCAAFLAKPSTFAMTFIVFGYSALARYVLEIVHERRFFFAAAARRAIMQALVFVVVTLPYTGPFGRDTWNYFWRNSFGANKAIWTYAGSSGEHLWYYLTGYGGMNNLGWPGVLAVLALAAAAASAVASRKPERIVRFVALCGLITVTWGVNTWAGMKSPFLGGAFYATIIFGSAMELPAVLRGFSARSRVILLSAMALAGIALYRFPPYSAELNSVDGRNYRSAVEDARKLVDSAELRDRPIVMFTQSGPVVPDDIEIWLLRKGVRARVLNQQFARSFEEFESKLGRADLIFIQPAGMRGAFLNLPSEPFQEKLRTLLDADKRYRLLGEVRGVDGNSVRIYERVRRHRDKADS